MFQAIFEVQENLQNELQREPTDAELAEAMNVTVRQLRRHLDVGRAARNKLIKVTNGMVYSASAIYCFVKCVKSETHSVHCVNI